MKELRIKPTKVGNFVIKIKEAINIDDDIVIVPENEEPKYISPEELKKKIDETEKALKEFYKEKIKYYQEKFGGKIFRKTHPMDAFFPERKMDKELKEFITFAFDAQLPRATEAIASLDVYNNAGLDELEEFIQEIKSYKPAKDEIAFSEGLDEEGYCDGEDFTLDSLNYVLTIYYLREPMEKYLKKQAITDVIYKNVFKAFRYDCEAIKDYIEGDITFKGLIKKISLFSERMCW